jgi:hypothetical protein
MLGRAPSEVLGRAEAEVLGRAEAEVLGRAEGKVLGRAAAEVLGRAAPGLQRCPPSRRRLQIRREVRAGQRSRLYPDPAPGVRHRPASRVQGRQPPAVQDRREAVHQPGAEAALRGPPAGGVRPGGAATVRYGPGQGGPARQSGEVPAHPAQELPSRAAGGDEAAGGEGVCHSYCEAVQEEETVLRVTLYETEQLILLKLLLKYIIYLHCFSSSVLSFIDSRLKVHMYIEYHSLCPLVGIGTPHPELQGGGGVPIPTTEEKAYYFAYCVVPSIRWALIGSSDIGRLQQLGRFRPFSYVTHIGY